MAQKDEGKYQVLSTKISSWAYAQIMKILNHKGINKYQLLQNMCEVILRFMSDKHNRTPEMEQAMETFENMEGWKDNFNLCDPNTKPEISARVSNTSPQRTNWNSRASMVCSGGKVWLKRTGLRWRS